MLGVVLDLNLTSEGCVKVSNKPSRMDELSSVLTDILNKGMVRCRDLPSLFGRALFVESQFAGRAGRLALSELRNLERSMKGTVKIDDMQRIAFNILLQRYNFGKPRSLSVVGDCRPVVVFTDGACETCEEELVASIGGVLFDPSAGGRPLVFGSRVSRDMLDEWTVQGKSHPVALTELYAVCVARKTWKGRLDNKRSLFFVDNQGVLDALIKGYSSEPSIKRLLLNFESCDSNGPCLAWFGRVPSSSNISDLPSRGLWKKFENLVSDYERTLPCCPIYNCMLESIDAAEEKMG